MRLSFLAAMLLLCACSTLRAELMSASVDGYLGNALLGPGAPSLFDNNSAIIGAGVEFSGNISDDLITANFDPITNILRIDFNHLGADSHGYFGFGAAFEFDSSVEVLGFTLLAGNTLPISSYGFTSNSLDVNFINVNFPGALSRFAEFQLEIAELNEVPEPASLAIWGLGSLGLAWGTRRRLKKQAA